MNTVEIGKLKRLLPSSWNELSYDQLIYVAGLFADKLTIVDFKAKVLLTFLNMKRGILLKIGNEDIYFMAETLDFLLKDVNLTVNRIKKIRMGFGRWLYGPDDAMGYCTFGEFVKAQVRYDAYTSTKEEKYLDELTAILYRPRKFLWFLRKHFTASTDPRVEFLDRTLEKRSARIGRLNHGIKYGVFLFVSGILGTLPKKFPNIYRQKGDDNTENPQGWAGLIIGLADGKTDDESLDRVMNSNLYNVFMGLEQKAIEYFRFTEEMEKRKTK
jgi:hypothetical protein